MIILKMLEKRPMVRDNILHNTEVLASNNFYVQIFQKHYKGECQSDN